jgi:hypothetical protein
MPKMIDAVHQTNTIPAKSSHSKVKDKKGKQKQHDDKNAVAHDAWKISLPPIMSYCKHPRLVQISARSP